MRKLQMNEEYCEECYIEGDICNDCVGNLCLNCIAYGDGGLCINCEGMDEGIDISHDYYLLSIWIRNNNMYCDSLEYYEMLSDFWSKF